MANLGAPNKTAEIIKKYDFTFKKKLGQNFLIDANILDKIVSGADVGKDDVVLEIGPGIGTLTQYLCERAKKVIAVEIDSALIPILQNDTLSEYDNVKILNRDILKTDIVKLIDEEGMGRPIKVVANLPYCISTPVIMELLEAGHGIESLTVMVQKEVAERMQADAGTKAYGALSVAVRFYTQSEIIADVSPNCFMPRPGVGSTVIKLKVRDEAPYGVSDTELMFRLVRASFNQRRKTLENSIYNCAELSLTKERIAEAVKKMGFPDGTRGESLSLRDFADFSNEIYKML